MARRKKKPKNSNVKNLNSQSKFMELKIEKHTAYIKLVVEIFKCINLLLIEFKLDNWLIPIIKALLP
ncbi:hypothetical protein LZZ98_07255 [Acinetobacter sp. SM34]|uniref:hypothetical protein n=1 Tax=Acinetobacter sp. SM34 TaxID=1301620 RepID=UPI001EDAFD07|nr:hypothetical protein [Acinetobacter sp. SM34]MCG2608334.1 hypothetical protein [Acinetobacter sp. SM34]